MMFFSPGDKVVCIDASSFGGFVSYELNGGRVSDLHLNSVYTIKKIEHHFGSVHFSFEEIDGFFVASRFDKFVHWHCNNKLKSKEYRTITDDFEISCES